MAGYYKINYMQDEKWQELISRIKDSFSVLENDIKDGEIDGEKTESIVFENSLGKMKLERTLKPKLLEEKTHYSGRVGSQTQVEKVYSQDEFISFVKLYRENNGEWNELDVSALF